MTRRFSFEDPDDEYQIGHLRRLLSGDGWSETAGEDWDLFWAAEEHEAEALSAHRAGRWLNHFPGVVSLDRKDELALYLNSARRRTENLAGSPRFDFLPRTFRIPFELAQFRRARRARPEALWLVKPIDGYGGRGIELSRDPDVDSLGADWIVQEYVADPLLLAGRPEKHVLRIYVLVTSLEPLVVYVSELGTARFAPKPYSTTAHALTDPNVQHIGCETPNVDLSEYRSLLLATGVDDFQLFSSIDSLVVELLIAHRETMLHRSLAQVARLDYCFELLGLDVLVDASGRPWLLEANTHPALGLDAPLGSASREAQRSSREPLVEDLLRLVGLTGGGSLRWVDGLTPIQRVAQEGERAGTWRRVFPAADARRFLPLFQVLRSADAELVRALEG